jgi:hypothetical protein
MPHSIYILATGSFVWERGGEPPQQKPRRSAGARQQTVLPTQVRAPVVPARATTGASALMGMMTSPPPTPTEDRRQACKPHLLAWHLEGAVDHVVRHRFVHQGT